MDDLNTRDRVLEAALKEFADHGYEGARVDRIASRAGVNKAMIYYHFKGKEALYETILMNIYHHIFESISTAALSGTSPLEQIYSVVNEYVNLVSSFERDILRVFMREIGSGGAYFRKLMVPNLIEPVFGIIRPIFEKARKQGMNPELNQFYTMFQIIGSVVFMNIMRISIEGTKLYDNIFRDDYLNQFRANLLSVLKNGIESEGGKQ